MATPGDVVGSLANNLEANISLDQGHSPIASMESDRPDNRNLIKLLKLKNGESHERTAETADGLRRMWTALKRSDENGVRRELSRRYQPTGEGASTGRVDPNGLDPDILEPLAEIPPLSAAVNRWTDHKSNNAYITIAKYLLFAGANPRTTYSFIPYKARFGEVYTSDEVLQKLVHYDGPHRLVALLCEYGSDPDLANSDGMTPLQEVIWRDESTNAKKTLKVLLNNNADPHVCRGKETPLGHALATDKSHFFELLLPFGAVNTLSDDETLLYIAVRKGDFAMVRKLLDLGADPHKASPKHNNNLPIHEAITRKDMAIYNMLLPHVPVLDDLVQHAIDAKATQILRDLLQRGIDIHQLTLVQYAIDANATQLLRDLVQLGIDIHQLIPVWDNESEAWHDWNLLTYTLRYHKSADIAKMLVEAGVDLKTPSGPMGRSALQLAVVDAKYNGLIDVMIAKGAGIDQVAADRWTPLGLAIWVGENPRAARTLIEAGANVNHACANPGEKLRTPLRWLKDLDKQTRRKFGDVQELLLQRGAESWKRW